ncbi:MAG: hypothetical protein A07HR60_01530 [uncultured archaeon A07HR60]|nr:MAG: hypothetical protein J07HR59_01652 [Halorubrum sp. J07HR59]ESS11474.1 MAG: hypothetical protein A07HR60_01530 [uncultured archaeon A07HR60]
MKAFVVSGPTGDEEPFSTRPLSLGLAKAQNGEADTTGHDREAGHSGV